MPFPIRRWLTVWFAATAVVHVALAWWVRRDAIRRGQDPGGWPLATLGGGLFGLIAYRRARR